MEGRICQSCGMPMTATEHFGTNNDKTNNKEYCCFCYQNGGFTDEFTFEEFIVDSVQNTLSGSYSETPLLSQDELILKERIRLASLKRWKSHQTTHQEYYKSVNAAVNFIDKHISDSLTLTDLARAAHISEYHFHRVFSAIMNESPGDYIQRLRLEKAAFKLQTSSLSINEIGESVGYQTSQSFTKAFKKRFGIPPIRFRKAPADLTVPLKEPVRNLFLTPEIKKMSPKKVICIQVFNPFTKKDAFLIAWQRLLTYLDLSGIPDEKHEYLCLSKDTSALTAPQHCRVYACVSFEKEIKPKGKFSVQTIEGGLYAVFKHIGPYKELETIYCNIYRYWLPNSNYELRDCLHFEKYLNNPEHVKESEIETEIYIPVDPIK